MSSTEPTSDDDKLATYAAALIAAFETHTASWIEHIVRERVDPTSVSPIVSALSADVDRALDEVRNVLVADIDEQRANPLSIVRSLVPALTAALAAAGVAPVVRDPDAVRLFPDDVFDLTPGAFSDVHPDLHSPGLAWGAAKAHVHLQRRRAEGLR